MNNPISTSLKKVFPLNQKGSIILPVVMGVLSLLAVSYFVAAKVTSAGHDNTGTQVKEMAELIQKEIRAVSEGQDGWLETIDRNPGLQCLKANGQVCSSSGDTPMNIAVGPNEPLLVSATADDGFTLNGLKCSGFNLQTGNDDCPFQYKMTYQFPPGSTVSQKSADEPFAHLPRVEVKGELLFKPEHASRFSPLNAEALKFSFTRGVEETAVQEPCLAAKGTYDPGTKFCRLSMSSEDCPPSSFVVGFDPVTGERHCRTFPLIGKQCAAGAAYVGFENGEFLCGKY